MPFSHIVCIHQQLQTPVIIAVKMEKWEYANVLVRKLGGMVR